MVEKRTWLLPPSVVKISGQWPQRNRWYASRCWENVNRRLSNNYQETDLIHRSLCIKLDATHGAFDAVLRIVVLGGCQQWILLRVMDLEPGTSPVSS